MLALRDARHGSTLRMAILAAVLALGAHGCTLDAADDTGAPTTVSPTAPRTVAATPTALPLIGVAACAPPYPTGPANAESVFCADPAGMEAGHVIRIVDGDTLHVDIAGRDETVRVYGIDTPERGEPCFGESSDLLERLVGSDVRLRPDVRDRDRYGRLLRYVYTPAGESIDARMVALGFAHAWTADGALRDAMVELERRAADATTGCLWSH